MTAMMMWRAAPCPTIGGHHSHAMSPSVSSTVTPGEWRAVRGHKRSSLLPDHMQVLPESGCALLGMLRVWLMHDDHAQQAEHLH